MLSLERRSPFWLALLAVALSACTGAPSDASGRGGTGAAGGTAGTASPAGGHGNTGGTGTGAGGAPAGGAAGPTGVGGGAGSGGTTGGGAGSGGTTGGGAAGAAGGGGDSGRAGRAGGGGAGGPTGAAGVGASAGGGRGGTGAPGPNDVDVYLIGGQSNATGQGYSKNIPSTFVIDTKVQIYHSSAIKSSGAANSWITLRAASEGADDCNLGLRFGPELGFGNAIQAFYPSRSIYLIKHAVSNTGLVMDWAPGSNASDTAHFGPQFQTFVATVDGGLRALKSQGLNPILRGMLWQQGERDVDMGETAAANYGRNLAAFIARVREQWSSPEMLFVYGYIYPASNFGTARDEVRQAEANVDQDSGNALAVKGAFVVTDDNLSLRANDPGTCLPSDKIHFGTQGQLDLGRLMAAKVHDKLALP